MWEMLRPGQRVGRVVILFDGDLQKQLYNHFKKLSSGVQLFNHGYWLLFVQKFPRVQDFDVQHDFLRSTKDNVQIRLRKRGQKGR